MVKLQLDSRIVSGCHRVWPVHRPDSDRRYSSQRPAPRVPLGADSYVLAGPSQPAQNTHSQRTRFNQIYSTVTLTSVPPLTRNKCS